MARVRRKVYVIKALSWHYNDECTIPGSADLYKAYARREDAERERRKLERKARAGAYSEAPAFGLRVSEAEIPAWLARFGVSPPPTVLGEDDQEEPNYWDAGWHERAREQLGEERYIEFSQAFFNDDPYYYHVIETELEV